MIRLCAAAPPLDPDDGSYAILSLISVGLTDLYIRLLGMGVLHDPAWITSQGFVIR